MRSYSFFLSHSEHLKKNLGNGSLLHMYYLCFDAELYWKTWRLGFQCWSYHLDHHCLHLQRIHRLLFLLLPDLLLLTLSFKSQGNWIRNRLSSWHSRLNLKSYLPWLSPEKQHKSNDHLRSIRHNRFKQRDALEIDKRSAFDWVDWGNWNGEGKEEIGNIIQSQ